MSALTGSYGRRESPVGIRDGMEWQSISTATPNFCVGARHQRFKHGVIGLVEGLDPRQPFGERNAVGVDGLALGNHAGNRAETSCDAQRARVGVGGRGLVEQFGVEFIGFAIGVEQGAGEMRPQHWRAVKRRR